MSVQWFELLGENAYPSAIGLEDQTSLDMRTRAWSHRLPTLGQTKSYRSTEKAGTQVLLCRAKEKVHIGGTVLYVSLQGVDIR